VTVVKSDLQGLQRTEASIRAQSLRLKWLVITPMDSSTTYQYVSKLRIEGLITNFIPDEGNGIYPAMNLAVKESKETDWLWFLNAGDEFAHEKSGEVVMKYIKDSQSKWLFGGNKLGSNEGEILGENSSPRFFDPRNQLFSRKYVSHQSTIFRNDFLKDLGGFREDLKIAADWDLMVRASKIDPGQRIPDVISIFYMGGSSTIHRRTGNHELLSLRKEHLTKRYSIKNYAWFCYREVRNLIVQSIESKLPRSSNNLRRIRLRLRRRMIDRGSL
jgi:hypothetical protein